MSQVTHDGIKNRYTSTGRISGVQVHLHHTGLNEYKHLSAPDSQALFGKINNQENIWQIKWDKVLEERKHQNESWNVDQANRNAQDRIKSVEKILAHTLDVNDALKWDVLKRKDQYSSLSSDSAVLRNDKYIRFHKKTGCPTGYEKIPYVSYPSEHEYFKEVGFWQILLGKKEAIKAEQLVKYLAAKASVDERNKSIDKANMGIEESYKAQLQLWESERKIFEAEKNIINASVENLKNNYEAHERDAVIEYCEKVLANSYYLETFPQEFDIDYRPDTKMLLVDYRLPSLKNMPTINNVRYVKSTRQREEKLISSAALAKLYDSCVYQIVLRTLHELFEADTANAIEAINLNGLVQDINLSTGHEETNCIVSVQVQKQTFEKINLEGIIATQSYKECFKSLKGVGSSKLSTLTAVKPILEMNKSDARFRDHYDVAHTLNDEVNLAAMDWADFEHLIREIFGKEFSSNGGEVKVTQASKDGGVDAIAFDPDPIRGGKIVIQAKRYTNTVGVSAVRDLYGTVLNEGATKGILVTTTDYGSDSYDFAKGKPITLLNGSNLLHLLQKHGHNAKIDIREAKLLASGK